MSNRSSAASCASSIASGSPDRIAPPASSGLPSTSIAAYTSWSSSAGGDRVKLLVVGRGVSSPSSRSTDLERVRGLRHGERAVVLGEAQRLAERAGRADLGHLDLVVVAADRPDAVVAITECVVDGLDVELAVEHREAVRRRVHLDEPTETSSTVQPSSSRNSSTRRSAPVLTAWGSSAADGRGRRRRRLLRIPDHARSTSRRPGRDRRCPVAAGRPRRARWHGPGRAVGDQPAVLERRLGQLGQPVLHRVVVARTRRCRRRRRPSAPASAACAVRGRRIERRTGHRMLRDGHGRRDDRRPQRLQVRVSGR